MEIADKQKGMKALKFAQIMRVFYLFSFTLFFPFILCAQDIIINSTNDSVYVFDNFDIIGSPINSDNGTSGFGWNESWQAPASNGTVSFSESGLYYLSGMAITSTGGHAYSVSPYGQGISRDLLHPVKLGESPTTFYVSFLTQKDATGNYRIDGLTSTGASAGFAIGITPDGRLKVNAGNTDGWGAVTTQSEAGVIEDNVTYFIVAQYTYENSQASVKVSAFKEGDTLPVNDDAYKWDYEATGGSLATSLHSIRLAFSKGLGRIDEFRLGSTWASVVTLDISDPVPEIGTYRFPDFDWEDYPDQFADVASPVSYEIQIASDEQFTSLVDRDTVLLSRYVHDEPFNTGTYFWRTRSITYDGEVSAWQDTLSFTIEAPEEIITVPPPAGDEDCTVSVQASVAAAEASAAAGKSVRLVFPAGDYYFGESLAGPAISFSGVRNIEIEGKGATFHFSKRNQGLIHAVACEKISISGINVTYAKGLLRVQGHVVSLDQNNKQVLVSIEDGSPGFEESSAPYFDIFILLDPDINGRLKDNSSHFYRMSSYQKNADDTYTVQITDGGDFSDWEVGDRFVFHFRSGSTSHVDFPDCKSVTAHNITTDGWGSMGFVSVKGSNFNVLNCKTEMQEGKWMMGNADGFHVREHVVGPWIEGTEIQATGDDGLAFYARPIAMTDVHPGGDERSVICTSEFFNLEPGDEVSFYQPTEGRILLETRVTRVVDQGGSYLAEFADTIPGGIILGSSLVDVTQIWNRSKSCGEFMIRNSKFINNRRYANVFRSKRGVVEKNLYQGASTRAILFINETAVPNGLYASEIILRNNTVEDCSFDGAGTQAPIAFYFEGRGSAVKSIGPRNILIEGHVIKDCPSPEIELVGARNVVIRNNVVILSDAEQDHVRFTANRSQEIFYTTEVHPEESKYVQGRAIHHILASSGSNGAIAPTGNLSLFDGDSEIFAFIPDPGYEIDDVLVDEISKGALDSYTFSNVQTNHSIEVRFLPIAGISTFVPEADAYVHGGSYANRNFGEDERLVVKTSTNPEYTRESYLRFDLSGIQNPIKSAKLQMKLASIDGSQAKHNLMHVEDDGWGETTITWSNKPSASEVVATKTPPGQGDWIEFDITGEAESARTSDGKMSLALKADASSEVLAIYYSREAGSANAPRIILSAPDSVHYTITATAGDGGSISPDGEISVLEGGSQFFTFIADSGYKVENVMVNGISQGPLETYEFTNINVNSTIHVTFSIVQSAKDDTMIHLGRISVYPNPARTMCTVLLNNTEKADLYLYEIMGRVVMSRKDIVGSYSFPVTNLQPGVYIVRVSIGDEFQEEILIVQ